MKHDHAALGWDHAVRADQEGIVSCLGWNRFGQAGPSNTLPAGLPGTAYYIPRWQNMPNAVPAKVQKVAAGEHHRFAAII